MIQFDYWLFIAQVGTFLIAVFLLWKVAWGPLSLTIKNRSERIRKDLDLIDLTRQAVKKLESEYETRLAEIQQKADEIVQEAKKEADKHKEEMLTLAHTEVESIRQKTLEQLLHERERLLKELRSEISVLSVDIAEKLIRQSVDPQIQERIFSETMQGFKKE